MLTGRFGDTTGRPYIEGRLLIPRLGLRSDISFCVDTGADRSLLLPADGMRMGIDYGGLQGNTESVGIGGVCNNFEESAVFVFTDPGRYLYGYAVELAICPPAQDIMDIPSLLGREVLNRWRMRYDAPRKQLAFRVLSSDFSISLR